MQVWSNDLSAVYIDIRDSLLTWMPVLVLWGNAK